jgi:hypothetical protein
VTLLRPALESLSYFTGGIVRKKFNGGVMEKTITGKIVSVNIKGKGRNSAQLLFVIENEKSGEKRPIMVTAYPDYEPQVFSAMASLVTAAYFSNKKITAGYESHAGETDRAVEVFVPGNSAK